MSAQPQKSNIDISKITGPYPLLGAFLVVVEGLLGFWLYRAENMTERIVTGSMMTLIFIIFLLAVLWLATKKEASKPISPQGLGVITPATEQVTEKQIAATEADDRFAAPDGSFTINNPPPGWLVQGLSYADWVGANQGITDPAIKAQLQAKSPVDGPIYEFKSTKDMTVIMLPGKTMLDGRKFPSAEVLTFPSRLSILPMERTQAPLFIERPLEHNFLLTLSEFLGVGTITLHRLEQGKIQNSRLRYWTAECRQDIQNALINGKEGNISSNVFVIGIEGELKDHLLIMNYPSMPAPSDPALDREHEILKSLVSSFRPLKILNPEKRREEIKNLADKKFQDFMAANGETLFWSQFGTVALKLVGVNLNDPEKRQRAIQIITPFEALAKELGIQDEILKKLWSALRKAEAGDAADFKAQIKELTDVVSQELKPNPEEAAPIALGDGDEAQSPDHQAAEP